MKSLKKAALDFNPVLETLSPNLYQGLSKRYELSVHSTHTGTPPARWCQLLLNWCKFLHKRIKQVTGLQYKTSLLSPTQPYYPTTETPIVKATTRISNEQTVQKLLGKTILCVGGRACLYPQYCDSIKLSGGDLLTFHGGVNESLERLYTLLSQADMVICPIDCVRHDLFFAVKHYCQYTHKPYVLLDRSEIKTFHKGVKVLAQINHQ